MRIPDIFIVGAPKSGTSSLAHWLSKNDSVFVPTIKEPRYFCEFNSPIQGPGSDLFMKSWVKDAKEYDKLYMDANDMQLKCDASVAYLSNKGAAERIYHANKNAKILIMLRNPVDRAYSEHNHLVRDTYESYEFEKAIELEAQRVEENWWPIFFHLRRSLYHDDVKKYLELFGDKQVKVIIFDDFKNNTEQEYRKICEYLDIIPNIVDFQEKHNASGRPKSRLIQKLLMSQFIRTMALKIIGRNLASKILQKIQKKNLSINQTISSETNADLKEYFKKDIDLTGKLIGKDLSFWYE